MEMGPEVEQRQKEAPKRKEGRGKADEVAYEVKAFATGQAVHSNQGPCLLWLLEQGDINGNFESDLGKEAVILRAWSPGLKANNLILIPV